MLKNFSYLILLTLAIGCSSTSKVVVIESDEMLVDSVEYELVVFEPDFNSWFLSHQKPVWYHTNDYYKHWNTIYANEWNHRYNNPIVYGIPFDYSIDYDLKTDYGIDLEHELFWFFKFVEDKYNIDLYFSNR